MRQLYYIIKQSIFYSKGRLASSCRNIHLVENKRATLTNKKIFSLDASDFSHGIHIVH